ncbi:MAG: GAF domain-containing protein [Dehalococcoidia bacterium]|nr:GAF domain-containing protein [Dehalococcoidia bacterium]
MINKKKMRAKPRETPVLQKDLEHILDCLDLAVMVVDARFKIRYANAAAVRGAGLDAAKMIGTPCYTVSHGLDRPCAPPAGDCPVKKVWETGEPALAVHTHSQVGADDREERYVEVCAFPLADTPGNPRGAVLFARDVTGTRKIEQWTAEASENLLALNAIASCVSQSLDLDEILNSALDKVLDLMQGDTGGILLLDPESQTLSYRVYRGLSPEFVRGVAGLKVGEGIAGTAAQQGEPIYVEDISVDSRVTRSVVVAEGLRAFASVPLISKGKVLGVMNIAGHNVRHFSSADVQLLNSISNQIAVAIENARLYQELQRKEEMRRELLHLVISAQEEERRRIARGLHDEISQALTSFAVNLETIAASLPADTGTFKEKLKTQQRLVLKTLDEIHKVIWELRPTLLDDLGLVAAVEWLGETHLEPAGVKSHLETAGLERRLPTRVETELFRIIQEAMTNIVRHASAESANISLEYEEEAVTAHIEDDGIGFNVEENTRATRNGHGLGLLSMKERAELLGGALSIQSQAGQGTQIKIRIPTDWKEAFDT